MNTLFELPTIKKIDHPAKYTDQLFPVFVRFLRGSARILDPFAGTGKIFDLQPWLPNTEIEGIEIEPEWVALHRRTTLGDALALPWPDDYFDAIITSPTYGNRFADKLLRDPKVSHTYANALRRLLHPHNSGSLQWGPAYRSFHEQAWTEARRVLSSNGRFILNIKDHYRKKQRQYVTDWHIATLMSLGFWLIDHQQIACPGNRHGRNHGARMEYESVILFQLGEK